jgi:hypothetical protein
MRRRGRVSYRGIGKYAVCVEASLLRIMNSMGSIGSRRLISLATAALGLLVVSGLAAPGSAWAGCNHLVSSRFDALREFDQLDELIQGGPITRSSDDRAEASRRPNRDKPCSGASCSGRMPLPVSTASQGSEGSEQWGALAPSVVGIDFAAATRHGDEPGTHSRGEAASIFHPPRG